MSPRRKPSKPSDCFETFLYGALSFKARARTLKNDAMSANDTHIEKTGRAGDRERYLIREWLAYPKTTFNKKKAAELLLPNIEIWEITLQRLEISLVQC